MGHRMSSLPIARYCGLAPRLQEGRAAGRRALMGSYFHAFAANDPEHEKLARNLTERELEEVRTWTTPPDVQVGKVTLCYQDAETELEVGLTTGGEYCDADHPDLLTLGHLDFAWLLDGVAYVADIKASEYTVEEGADSLQIHAYGLAYAKKMGADHYCAGIYAAAEGRYTWGEMVDVDWDSPFADLEAAALNEEACTGPHCSRCYGRLHCPEHTIRAVEGMGKLAPVAEGGELSAETALDALGMVKAMEDLAKQAKGHLQEWARRNGGIPDGNGKVYLPVMTQGRESVCSAKKLRQTLGDAAEMFVKRGKPFEQWRWVKK